MSKLQKTVFAIFTIAAMALSETRSFSAIPYKTDIADAIYGCRYLFRATIIGATEYGWYNPFGNPINGQDVTANHIFTEETVINATTVITELIIDQATEDATYSLFANDENTNVEEMFKLSLLPDSMPISVIFGIELKESVMEQNISMSSYSVGDQVPLTCLITSCRSWNGTVELVDSSGSVIQFKTVNLLEGSLSISFKVLVGGSEEYPVEYSCRVKTSLRGETFSALSNVTLSGTPASATTPSVTPRPTSPTPLPPFSGSISWRCSLLVMATFLIATVLCHF